MRTIALLLLLVAAGCASGGRPDLPPGGAALLEPGPSVYALLGDRARLDLSSAQVSALDSIGQWLVEVNSPLNHELRRLGVVTGFGGPGAQRRGPIPEPALPLLEQVAANNRRAAASIGDVLTDEQRTLACEPPRRGAAGREARAQRRPVRRGTPMDSVFAARQRPWPWCGPEPRSS